LVLALCCAMASYYGVERPFLSLRERRKKTFKSGQAGMRKTGAAKQAAEDIAARVV
jgi:peptidoglycan/LPS O-acetylase OafA/YrhL